MIDPKLLLAKANEQENKKPVTKAPVKADSLLSKALESQVLPLNISDTTRLKEAEAGLTQTYTPPETEEERTLKDVIGGKDDFVAGAKALARGATGLLSADILTGPLTQVLNSKLGTNYESPKEGMLKMLEKVGIGPAEGKTEQLAEDLSSAIIDTMATLGTGMGLQVGKGLGTNIAKNVGKQISADASSQLAGAGTGILVGEGLKTGAEKLGFGDKGQAIAQVAGNILGDVSGTKMAMDANKLLKARTTPMSAENAATLAKTKPYGELTTSELLPPKTQKGTTLQRIREGVPGGGGELQFKRQQERVSNIKDVMKDYGVEVDELGNTSTFSQELMDDFLNTRSAKLEKNVTAKKEVIADLTEGAVPVSKATEFLEDELSTLMKRDTPVANKLNGIVTTWREAIQDKDLTTLELTRADFLDGLLGADNDNIRKQGTKILDKAYSLLVEDMGDYIKTTGGKEAYDKWQVANRNLSGMAKEFKDKAFFNLLKEGQKNPENMRVEDIDKLVFSQNKTDVEKIYNRLSNSGKDIMRTALISKFAQNANTTELSGAKFAKAIKDHGKAVGIAFSPEQQKQLVGLKTYLDTTARSESIVAGSKGYSGLPTGDLPGSGTAISMGVRKAPVVGLIFSALGTNTLGKAAKFYESPKIRNLMAQLAEVKPESEAATNIAKIINRVINEQTKNSNERNIPEGEK